jgi:hypothetical protein
MIILGEKYDKVNESRQNNLATYTNVSLGRFGSQCWSAALFKLGRKISWHIYYIKN